MDSLTRLKIYCGSDDDDDDDDDGKEKEEDKFKRLPVPTFCVSASFKNLPKKEENHEGKIRNFPHESGNWATYVYLPVDSLELSEFVKKISIYFQPLNLKLVDDFHISLTKTVVLKHHWIQGFTESIKSHLTDIGCFKIHLFGLKTYLNEQKTRTFLSLEVTEGKQNLKMIVNQLNSCLTEYNLPLFYQNPSFHLSLLWCTGDKSCEINKFIDNLPLKLSNFSFYINAFHCICTSGI